MEIKISMKKEKFIEKAKNKHGDKYDYSKVEYKNAHTKVCIICKEHGEFWQTPSNHLAGHGCQKCKTDKVISHNKLSTEIFIEKCKKLHGDKYDYSKVNYINNYTKVCIICPKHGEFWQIPSDHLRGRGCSKCSKNKPLTTEEFINSAKKVHGNKYNYSKVEYKGSQSKVCIICPKHGEFWQTPNAHLNGNGCPRCKAITIGERCSHSKEEFIKLAEKVHGDKYDYSKVNYVNNYTKVCIICPKHGEFWQKPTLHLQGCGCPICKESKLETEIREFLIIEKITFEEKKHFDWLGKQHIDFFIPEYNVGIECQGEGHFENVEYFGGINSFKKRLKLDENKNFICKNKIKLYYYTSEKNLKINKILPSIYNNNIFTNKMELLQKIKG